MCCLGSARFYRSRIILLAVLACLEATFGIFRVIIFCAPGLTSDGTFDFNNIANVTDHITITFILDCASSLGAMITGLFVILFVLLSPVLFCLVCCYGICRSINGTTQKRCFRSIFNAKAMHRFIAWDCNCPCYRARPKLRFRLRFYFLVLCLLARAAAVFLYYTLFDIDGRAISNFYSCTISSSFLIMTIILDIYRYSVWWCYTPSIDNTCCGRSSKHIRYIPYHMASDKERTGMLGDRPCTQIPCKNRNLSHVVVFHSEAFRPQERWSKVRESSSKGTYIGFHKTSPKAAAAIVHSEFRPGQKSGMLGKGVYFARSIAGADKKAIGGTDVCIVAEIKMGKVFEFNKTTIYDVPRGERRDKKTYDMVTNSKWQDDFDTCYMDHREEEKDEFCIKDPRKQVLKWVVVVNKGNDPKVADYGLDTEFDSTRCFCV